VYFKPFEIFTQILPLPSYSSFDPTIFMGIFFPLFFGMILGDMGYGAILFFISLIMIFKTKEGSFASDAGKVMSVSAIYTIIFGFLYGEFFGSLGKQVFGIRPILIDREKEILPMAYLAVSIGVFHILLGLVLNGVTQIKSKNIKKNCYKFYHVYSCSCNYHIVAPIFKGGNEQLSINLLWIVGGLVIVLIILDGLLVPLEVLKSMGNIISYVRIMATRACFCECLAHVANIALWKNG